MTCQKVQERLLLYLGAELEPPESTQVAEHLVSCPACTEVAEALAETQDLVDGLLRTTVEAPPSLDLRVMEQVRATAPPRRPWRSFTPPWNLRRRLALAIVAFGLLAGGYAVGQWHPGGPGRNTVSSLPGARNSEGVSARTTLSLTLLGNDHRKYLANPSPAQIPGPNAREVAVGLTPLLQFPVAEIDLETEGARLLGGRKCKAHGVPIAFLLYEWKGERVSLYQIDGRKLSLPPLQEVSFRGRSFRVGEADGLSYVAWQSGAMQFVMVSGAQPEQLVPLACAASGMSHPA